MRARIGMALGAYWGGIAYAIDVIALISTLGAIGGLPALLNAPHQVHALRHEAVAGSALASGASSVSRHVQ